MKIAISGGTGFIGKILVDYHLSNGDEVSILTRSKSNNIWNEKVSTHIGNLKEITVKDLIPFLDGADIFYHCAAELKNESAMHEVHVTGTEKLLNATQQAKIKKWVQLSSVGVYGPQSNGIITEETTLNPNNTYEKTKTISDQILITFAAQNTLPYTILRPSNVFGSKMPSPHLYKLFSMIEKHLYFYIGKGAPQASYVHVNNVVKALITIGKSQRANFNIYNISDELPLKNFVETIADTLAVQHPFIRLPSALISMPGHCVSKLPIISKLGKQALALHHHLTNETIYSSDKIKKELNYQHEVFLKEGIADLVRYWKKPKQN